MRLIKYLLLIVPAALALYVIAPYGDRCSGLAHVLAWMILAGMYVIIFLAQTSTGLYFRFSIKKRFDVVPLIITCIAGILCITFWRSENLKPWTEVAFKGRAEVGGTRYATLTLYTNGSFDANSAYADWSCTYVGTYEWKHDTLWLSRSDITSLTDSAFTTIYRLTLPDNALVPIEDSFKPILRLTPAY